MFSIFYWFNNLLKAITIIKHSSLLFFFFQYLYMADLPVDRFDVNTLQLSLIPCRWQYFFFSFA